MLKGFLCKIQRDSTQKKNSQRLNGGEEEQLSYKEIVSPYEILIKKIIFYA